MCCEPWPGLVGVFSSPLVFFFFPLFSPNLGPALIVPVEMGEKQAEAAPHMASADRHDQAVVYLEGHGDVRPNVDLVALRRKIDRRLLPYMFCCYVLQFLDKVMLNVSVVQLLSTLVIA